VEGAYLAVARFRKPHGLKGEALLWVLTDEPERILSVGQRLTPVDTVGRAVGMPLTIERSRAYHRQWLVKFEGVDDRTELERWDEVLFGVRREELTAPAENEAYVHELPGMEVIVAGRPAGRVKDVVEIPAGRLLVVETDGHEVLVPFRKPIVQWVDREERRIEIEPPPGLLEL
jgi:16S rRNA processing protein RimM